MPKNKPIQAPATVRTKEPVSIYNNHSLNAFIYPPIKTKGAHLERLLDLLNIYLLLEINHWQNINQWSL